MTMNSDNLVEALRDELLEYGGLLSLFKDQQTAILNRAPEPILALQESIRLQLDTIHLCGEHRKRVMRESTKATGREVKTSGNALVKFGEVVRPLLHALIFEVTRLGSRAKRNGRQNQMLLARSIQAPRRNVNGLPDVQTCW